VGGNEKKEVIVPIERKPDFLNAFEGFFVQVVFVHEVVELSDRNAGLLGTSVNAAFVDPQQALEIVEFGLLHCSRPNRSQGLFDVHGQKGQRRLLSVE
jgi:hypothetical protein